MEVSSTHRAPRDLTATTHLVQCAHDHPHHQPRTRTLPLRLPPPGVRLHGQPLPDVRGGARARAGGQARSPQAARR